jgi:hypothetical protein
MLTPIKFGTSGGLVCCEMVTGRGKSLGQQLRELFAEVGSFYPLRENFRLTPEVKEKFTKKLRLNPHSFAGKRTADAECRR